MVDDRGHGAQVGTVTVSTGGTPPRSASERRRRAHRYSCLFMFVLAACSSPPPRGEPPRDRGQSPSRNISADQTVVADLWLWPFSSGRFRCERGFSHSPRVLVPWPTIGPAVHIAPGARFDPARSFRFGVAGRDSERAIRAPADGWVTRIVEYPTGEQGCAPTLYLPSLQGSVYSVELRVESVVGTVEITWCGFESVRVWEGDRIVQGMPLGEAPDASRGGGRMTLHTRLHQPRARSSHATSIRNLVVRSHASDPFGWRGPGADPWEAYESDAYVGGRSEWLWLPAAEGGIDDRPPCGPHAPWIEARRKPGVR